MSFAPRSVLFVVTEDWYFVSHRLALARVLQQAGWRVALAARFSTHQPMLEAEGIRCLPIRLRRSGTTLLDEWASVVELRRLFLREKPTLVHHVAMKPVILGGLAAVGLPGIVLVNAIAGLGFLFSSKSRRAMVGRFVVLPLMRWLLGRRYAWTIVQNPDDAAVLQRRRIGRPGHVALICGAGVDVQTFHPTPEPDGEVVVLFAGRMLRDKGVSDFVEAARIARARGVQARFELVGAPDADSPASHVQGELEQWHREGTVVWRGHTTAMPETLAAAHLLCLPTVYGEGVPKILIEAAACGRAIVATDWPGCREIVRNGENGLLVPPRDPAALADAVARLVGDPALRRRMGAAGALLAAAEFSVEAVAASTLALYDRATR